MSLVIWKKKLKVIYIQSSFFKQKRLQCHSNFISHMTVLQFVVSDLTRKISCYRFMCAFQEKSTYQNSTEIFWTFAWILLHCSLLPLPQPHQKPLKQSIFYTFVSIGQFFFSWIGCEWKAFYPKPGIPFWSLWPVFSNNCSIVNILS